MILNQIELLEAARRIIIVFHPHCLLHACQATTAIPQPKQARPANNLGAPDLLQQRECLYQVLRIFYLNSGQDRAQCISSLQAWIYACLIIISSSLLCFFFIHS